MSALTVPTNVVGATMQPTYQQYSGTQPRESPLAALPRSNRPLGSTTVQTFAQPTYQQAYNPQTTFGASATGSYGVPATTVSYGAPVPTGSYGSTIPAGSAPAYNSSITQSHYGTEGLAASHTLAQMHSQSVMRQGDREYSAAVSHVSGVVPTGLFTHYVPAAQLTGLATADDGTISEADLNAIDQNRTAKPVTVYYTDDLYPPYYAKARKTKTTTRSSPGCCQ